MAFPCSHDFDEKSSSAETEIPPKIAEDRRQPWGRSAFLAGKTLANREIPCRVAPLQSSDLAFLPACIVRPASILKPPISLDTGSHAWKTFRAPPFAGFQPRCSRLAHRRAIYHGLGGIRTLVATCLLWQEIVMNWLALFLKKLALGRSRKETV